MVELIDVAVILGGAVLLFFGAALSVYGVGILGVVVGGGAGYLFAPTIGGLLGFEGIAGVAAATALGVVVGLVLTYLLLSMAVAMLSFVAGVYAGLVVIVPMLGGDMGLLAYPAAFVVGLAAAGLGAFLTRTVLVLVTAFVGATLASGSLTVADVAAAGEDLAVEPLLFDVAEPVFLGLLALGILTQFGLFKFGYVTKLVGILPGASVLRDRRRGDASG
jgi:hypothetical protein